MLRNLHRCICKRNRNRACRGRTCNETEDNIICFLTQGFTGETPTGQEEISLTAHLDNEDSPAFVLTLYRYDGKNCIAAVDGKIIASVPRSQTVALIEAVNELTLGS